MRSEMMNRHRSTPSDTDYPPGDTPNHGQTASWAELQALVRELRPSDETVTRGECQATQRPTLRQRWQSVSVRHFP